MKRLLTYPIILIIVIITYHLSSSKISLNIIESYGEDLNDSRMNNGLQTVSVKIPCDSSIYLGIGDSEDFSFMFGNEKSFSKGWTFPWCDEAYYKYKLINYKKSYWFWENSIEYEIDTYVSPLT
jgi:hypothetical protein